MLNNLPGFEGLQAALRSKFEIKSLEHCRLTGNCNFAEDYLADKIYLNYFYSIYLKKPKLPPKKPRVWLFFLQKMCSVPHSQTLDPPVHNRALEI